MRERRTEDRAGRREHDCYQEGALSRMWELIETKVSKQLFYWLMGLAVLLLMAQFNKMETKIDRIYDDISDIKVSISKAGFRNAITFEEKEYVHKGH